MADGFDIFAMPVKFFPRDVIGKQPEKVGDRFKAFFITGEQTFEVFQLSGGCIHATMVEE